VDGGALGLLVLRLLGGDESIGSAGLSQAPAGVPPFQEVAALLVDLVFSGDADMIAADAALGIEQGRRVLPRAVDFDLLEEPDRAELGHRGDPGCAPVEPSIDSPMRVSVTSARLVNREMRKAARVAAFREIWRGRRDSNPRPLP